MYMYIYNGHHEKLKCEQMSGYARPRFSLPCEATSACLSEQQSYELLTHTGGTSSLTGKGANVAAEA